MKQCPQANAAQHGDPVPHGILCLKGVQANFKVEGLGLRRGDLHDIGSEGLLSLPAGFTSKVSRCLNG